MKRALLLLILFAGSGCASAGSNLLNNPRWVDTVPRNYEIVEHAVSGEACNSSFLGFPLTREVLGQALSKIHKAVEGKVPSQDYTLVNVATDSRFGFYLLYWYSCDTITADIAVLKEPLPSAIILKE